jgi:hypothetical protein
MEIVPNDDWLTMDLAFYRNKYKPDRRHLKRRLRRPTKRRLNN